MQKERDFIADMNTLFDIFCDLSNLLKRKELKKQNNLHMSDRDYSFYENQKDQRKKSILNNRILEIFLASGTKPGKETQLQV